MLSFLGTQQVIIPLPVKLEEPARTQRHTIPPLLNFAVDDVSPLDVLAHVRLELLQVGILPFHLFELGVDPIANTILCSSEIPVILLFLFFEDEFCHQAQQLRLFSDFKLGLTTNFQDGYISNIAVAQQLFKLKSITLILNSPVLNCVILA